DLQGVIHDSRRRGGRRVLNMAHFEETQECDPPVSLSTNSFDRINVLCESFSKEWERGRGDIAAYHSQVAPEDQPTLLRNLLELEVRTRRKNGEKPSAQEYIARLPQSEGLIRRVFLDSSSVSMAAVHEPGPRDSSTRSPAASRLGEYRLV